MTSDVSSPTTPMPLALLLCDTMITDANTRKTTIVGIFERILVNSFPASHQLSIYARLTDAQGQYEFRFDYAQVKTNTILAQGGFKNVNVPDRLIAFEILLTPPPIPIPEAGQYEFRLWANNRYVGRVGFTAVARSRGADKS